MHELLAIHFRNVSRHLGLSRLGGPKASTTPLALLAGDNGASRLRELLGGRFALSPLLALMSS
jgi:hypothetical protein